MLTPARWHLARAAARRDASTADVRAIVAAQLRDLVKLENAALAPLLVHYRRLRSDLVRDLARGSGKVTEAHRRVILAQASAAIAVMERASAGDLAAHVEDALRDGWVYQLEHVRALETRLGNPAIAQRLTYIRPVIPASTVYSIGRTQNLILSRFGNRMRGYVAAELAQSIARGEGSRVAARRLGTVIDGKAYELERIARTEINAGVNTGHLGALEQLAGEFPEMGMQKQWSSHLDNRTSTRCRSLNGDIVGAHATFHAVDGWSGERPPAHPNCRSRVNGFSERWGGKQAQPGHPGAVTPPPPPPRPVRPRRPIPPVVPPPLPPVIPPPVVPIIPPAPVAPVVPLAPPVPVAPPAPVLSSLAQRFQAARGAGVQGEQHAIQLGGIIADEVEARVAVVIPAHEAELAGHMADLAILRHEQASFFGTILAVPVNPRKAAIVVEMDVARAGIAAAYKAIESARRRVTLDALAELRPMGAAPGWEHPWAPQSQVKAKGELAQAFEHYPRAWLEASATKGHMLAKATPNRCSYTNGYTPRILVRGELSVAVHEVAHRMEDTKRDVGDLEREFYRRRTAGAPLKWIGPGYKKAEVTREGGFANPYVGKDYGQGTFFEVFSMGVEAVFYDKHGIRLRDPEHLRLTLGILGGL